MSDEQYGPGPIILGPANDGTNRTIIRYRDQPGVHYLTHTEICALPIRHQWFAGSRSGLITSWEPPDRAASYAHESSTILGQIMPYTITQLAANGIGPDDLIVILADPNGTPLRGAQ